MACHLNRQSQAHDSKGPPSTLASLEAGLPGSGTAWRESVPRDISLRNKCAKVTPSPDWGRSGKSRLGGQRGGGLSTTPGSPGPASLRVFAMPGGRDGGGGAPGQAPRRGWGLTRVDL